MKPNCSGQAGERNITAALRHAGVRFETQVVVGRTIYGTQRRVDVLATNLIAFPQGLIFESKWQDTGGTADEKFPYLVENIRQAGGLPTIVVVHGGGCRDGALTWLRNRVDGQRLVAVFNLEELTSWLLRADTLASPLLFGTHR